MDSWHVCSAETYTLLGADLHTMLNSRIIHTTMCLHNLLIYRPNHQASQYYHPRYLSATRALSFHQKSSWRIRRYTEQDPRLTVSGGAAVAMSWSFKQCMNLASTERGEPLRKMLLPEGIHARFLSIAQPNTNKKIETCGILAGTLVSGCQPMYMDNG